MSSSNLTVLHSWKSIVGIIYIVLAVVLFVLGRVSLFEAAMLLGIGVILV